MDQIIAAVNTFASAHPYYFAVASGLGGFAAKSWLFTQGNARRLVKGYFAWQRAQLKKLGKTDAEIQEIMKGEAALLTAAAQEAQEEAAGAPAETATRP
jgi:hypothetical protein